MTLLSTDRPLGGFASDAARTEIAAALLRVTSGGLFVAHGLLKLLVFGPAGTAGYFASLGLPGWLGWLTMAAEILGGIALILGLRVRAVSLVLLPVLLGAAIVAHGPNGFWFSAPGGGWEYPVFWAVTLAVQALLGAGAYSLDRRG